MSSSEETKNDLMVTVPSAKAEDQTKDPAFDSIIKSGSADGHGIELSMAPLMDSAEPIKDSKVSPPFTFWSRTLSSP